MGTAGSRARNPSTRDTRLSCSHLDRCLPEIPPTPTYLWVLTVILLVHFITIDYSHITPEMQVPLDIESLEEVNDWSLGPRSRGRVPGAEM